MALRQGLCRRRTAHPWPDLHRPSARPQRWVAPLEDFTIADTPWARRCTASHALRGSGYGAAVGAGTPGSGARARCRVCRAAGAAAAHARATSRGTIGVAASPGARGVEANCALMPAATATRQPSAPGPSACSARSWPDMQPRPIWPRAPRGAPSRRATTALRGHPRRVEDPGPGHRRDGHGQGRLQLRLPAIGVGLA